MFKFFIFVSLSSLWISCSKEPSSSELFAEQGITLQELKDNIIGVKKGINAELSDVDQQIRIIDEELSHLQGEMRKNKLEQKKKLSAIRQELFEMDQNYKRELEDLYNDIDRRFRQNNRKTNEYINSLVTVLIERIKINNEGIRRNSEAIQLLGIRVTKLEDRVTKLEDKVNNSNPQPPPRPQPQPPPIQEPSKEELQRICNNLMERHYAIKRTQSDKFSSVWMAYATAHSDEPGGIKRVCESVRGCRMIQVTSGCYQEKCYLANYSCLHFPSMLCQELRFDQEHCRARGDCRWNNGCFNR